MNERIKEIEGQCWEHEPSWTGVDKLVFNREKFGELIVQECMQMCEVARVGYLTHGNTLQGEGCQGAKRYIADWFEVDEI